MLSKDHFQGLNWVGSNILWLNWLQKEVSLYVSLWVSDSTSHLIYNLSNQFSESFMVSIPSFKSTLTQHHVRSLTEGPV